MDTEPNGCNTPQKQDPVFCRSQETPETPRKGVNHGQKAMIDFHPDPSVLQLEAVATDFNKGDRVDFESY